MRKSFNFILVVLVIISIIGFWALYAYADKYDGDCMPDATAGRCADKCPDGQYLQGYDKDTGAAVCHDDIDPAPAMSTPAAANVNTNVNTAAPVQYETPTDVTYWEGK